MLAIVENRTYRRLVCEVLDHNPTQEDVERFFRRFKKLGKTLKKLFSPNLEKALTFLDDKLLPATSNAAERGYRRHRKMQKTIYCVRKRHTLIGRLALDHIRDQFTTENALALLALHTSRSRRIVSGAHGNPSHLPLRPICLANPAPQAKAG